jgi:HEAT repeat protein
VTPGIASDGRGEPLVASNRALAVEGDRPKAEVLSSTALARLDPRELIKRFRDADGATAERIRSELERRGFGQVQIELCRQLADPDPQARKRLARTLPEMHSVNAVPWLLWLARDEDAEVRLAAITLLATTADPAVLLEVERTAQADTDPRIQEQAARMMRQHGDPVEEARRR